MWSAGGKRPGPARAPTGSSRGARRPVRVANRYSNGLGASFHSQVEGSRREGRKVAAPLMPPDTVSSHLVPVWPGSCCRGQRGAAHLYEHQLADSDRRQSLDPSFRAGRGAR